MELAVAGRVPLAPHFVEARQQGQDVAQALESLERSRASARSANPGVGLEYLRGQEGRTNQVLIGWENGASNTLSVQGVFQPS